MSVPMDDDGGGGGDRAPRSAASDDGGGGIYAQMGREMASLGAAGGVNLYVAETPRRTVGPSNPPARGGLGQR